MTERPTTPHTVTVEPLSGGYVGGFLLAGACRGMDPELYRLAWEGCLHGFLHGDPEAASECAHERLERHLESCQLPAADGG